MSGADLVTEIPIQRFDVHQWYGFPKFLSAVSLTDHDASALFKVWRPRSVSLGLSWSQGFQVCTTSFFALRGNSQVLCSIPCQLYVLSCGYSMILLSLKNAPATAILREFPSSLTCEVTSGLTLSRWRIRTSQVGTRRTSCSRRPNSHGPRWFGG